MYRVVSLYRCIADVSGKDVSEKMYRVLPVRRRVTDCIGCIAPKEGSDTLYRCIAHSQNPSQEAFVTSWPCIEHWYGLQMSLFTCCDICNTSQVEF